MSTQPSEWRQVHRQGYPVAEGVGEAVPTNVPGGQSLGSIWRLVLAVWTPIWVRIKTRRAAQARRSLRVIETVGMGEKRFLAVVEVQQARFLIGGGSAGVSLLARLEPDITPKPDFAAVLDEAGALSPEKMHGAMSDARQEAW